MTKPNFYMFLLILHCLIDFEVNMSEGNALIRFLFTGTTYKHQGVF